MPEQYVHRIGRTARAGAAGVAISFVGEDERGFLRDIERLTRLTIDLAALPEGFAPPSAPSQGRPGADKRGAGGKPSGARGPKRRSRRPRPTGARQPVAA